MSRRDSTVSNASSVSVDDSMTIYNVYKKLSDFSDAPELATYSNYIFYQCWGGGPVGGFITKVMTGIYYRINKTGIYSAFTIEKLNNIEVDIDSQDNVPVNITIRKMPVVKLTKQQFFDKLSTHFKDDDFNPLIDHDSQVIIEIRTCDIITRWLKDWIKMFNQKNSSLNLNVEIYKVKSDCYMLSYDCYNLAWPESDSNESVEFEYDYQNEFVLEATD